MRSPPQVLVVTSLRPGCGRTAVALQIAAAWAETRRVAFVDADPARAATERGHSVLPRLHWLEEDSLPEGTDAVVVDAAPGPPEPLPGAEVEWLVLCPASAADDLDAFLAAAATHPDFKKTLGVVVAEAGDAGAATQATVPLKLRHGARVAARPLPHDPAAASFRGPLAAACRALAFDLAAAPSAPRAIVPVAQRADRPLTLPRKRAHDATPAWQVWAVALVFVAAIGAFRWQAEVAAWAETAFPKLVALAAR